MAERREENHVRANLKKKNEGRNNFFSITQKKRRKKNMLCEVDSRTELPPQNLSDMGPRDTGYIPIHLSETLTILYLFICLLVPVALELYHF